MTDQEAMIAAMRQEYEQLILNVSHQCADRAMVIAAQSRRIKALEAEARVQKPEGSAS